MSEPEFTPGPWRVQQCFERVRGDSYVVLANDDLCKVAECWVDAPSTDDEARKATAADARLIAAAPELFAALSRAMEWAGTIVADEGFVPDGLLGAMHDALLKAVGR